MHIAGFIIGIYHDARSSERQNLLLLFTIVSDFADIRCQAIHTHTHTHTLQHILIMSIC
jgi:hypothetical protein